VSRDVELDELMCFALYSASRTMINAYRPLLDEVGLTYPQYLVLLVLWQHGPQPVGELGRLLRLDSGTLSPLVKRLASAGLVSRDRRADDERSVLVSLTGAGRELEARARDIPYRAACGFDMSAEEIRRMHADLRRFTDTVDAARNR
jgi:DNA-binding MarR family transcriptional regulator